MCAGIVSSVLCAYYTTFRGKDILIKARKMLSITTFIYFVYGRFLYNMFWSKGTVFLSLFIYLGHVVAQWLRHCTTNWKVAGLIPDGVIGIFR
jgi:hypothetical protein